MKHLADSNFNTNKLENIPTPINDNDAANKAYVDTKVNKNTLYYNVKDFGAIGDGTTNDTTAIQAALDAAAANGGIVFFPPGTYSVTPVYAASGVSILGAGNDKTIVKRRNQATNNPSNSVGAINFHGTSGAPLHRFFVRDISADGNRGGITLGTGALVDNEAFSFIYCRNFTVDSCQGINAPGEGFDFDYCVNGTVTSSIGNSNGGNGFHASLDSSRLKFIGNYAFGNGSVYSRAGFDQWNTAQDCIYIGNIAEANYQNYKIHGSGAILSGNQSLNATTVDDDFSGADASQSVIQHKAGATASVKGETIEQSGWSWILGTGSGTSQTGAVTFPIAVDEVLSVQVSYIGALNGSDPSGIGSFTTPVSSSNGAIGTDSITTTGMNVTLARTTGSWASGWRYGFSWRISARKKKNT